MLQSMVPLITGLARGRSPRFSLRGYSDVKSELRLGARKRLPSTLNEACDLSGASISTRPDLLQDETELLAWHYHLTL